VRPEQLPGADPGDGDLLEWYDEARAGLVKALREIPPAAPVAVWWQGGHRQRP